MLQWIEGLPTTVGERIREAATKLGGGDWPPRGDASAALGLEEYMELEGVWTDYS